MMKRLSIIVAFSLLLVSTSALAEGLKVGATVNNRAVGAEVGVVTASPYGSLEASGGVLYNKHRYTIFNGLVNLRTDNLNPGLRYGLGFKFVSGDVNSKDRSRDADLNALGFNAGVGYELPATVNPFDIPIEVAAACTLSPESISFGDTKSYQDYEVALRFYVLTNAYVAIKHSYIDAKFTTGGTWHRYINETTAGIVLTF